MVYGDEEIIRQRVAAKAKQAHSIERAVEIDGIEYTFSRKEFPFGFSMVVPEGFTEIPHNVAKQMFPYEDRPKAILCNEDYTVCILFNDDEQGQNLEERVKDYRSYIKRLNPANVFFTYGVYEVSDEVRIGYYDYRYPALECDLYNLTIVADLEETALLGWFICPAEVQKKWEPLMRQMVQTIAITNKEG